MDHPQKDDVLEGTTRRVFRFLYRRREPTRIHDIQRGLGLSSPSVAYYHVNKLLKAGLVKETGDGYAADKVIFENMIRIRKTTLPAQAAYAAFFFVVVVAMVGYLRPAQLTSSYLFGLIAVIAAFGIFCFQAYWAAREPF